MDGNVGKEGAGKELNIVRTLHELMKTVEGWGREEKEKKVVLQEIKNNIQCLLVNSKQAEKTPQRKKDNESYKSISSRFKKKPTTILDNLFSPGNRNKTPPPNRTIPTCMPSTSFKSPPRSNIYKFESTTSSKLCSPKSSIFGKKAHSHRDSSKEAIDRLFSHLTRTKQKMLREDYQTKVLNANDKSLTSVVDGSEKIKLNSPGRRIFDSSIASPSRFKGSSTHLSSMCKSPPKTISINLVEDDKDRTLLVGSATTQYIQIRVKGGQVLINPPPQPQSPQPQQSLQQQTQTNLNSIQIISSESKSSMRTPLRPSRIVDNTLETCSTSQLERYKGPSKLTSPLSCTKRKTAVGEEYALDKENNYRARLAEREKTGLAGIESLQAEINERFGAIAEKVRALN